jgi:SagB-type dehydrogenase family enzyme
LGDIKLPQPRHKGKLSLEETILRRRSVREFSSRPVALEDLSQILWAAQGVTGKLWGYELRAVPSAGALFPIEIFVASKEGVHHYYPRKHELKQVSGEDVRKSLCDAALRQEFIAEAPVVLVITAVFERTKAKYGERGTRYVFAEAGHVSQNIYLQCESLGLSTVTVGAFYDDRVQEALRIPKDYRPIYIMPIGYKR